jgi:hypothetical protein
MSERIDDLEKTVCKLVEESNTNETLNNNNVNIIDKNSKGGSNKLDSSDNI